MQITITAGGLVQKRINEGSAFTATANFFSDAYVATAPTNAYYRVDWVDNDPSCNRTLVDWTALVAASSIAIPISATANAIQDNCNNLEGRQITVSGDRGLSTQTLKTLRYSVQNLAGTS